jgi:heat shock protein HslJ
MRMIQTAPGWFILSMVIGLALVGCAAVEGDSGAADAHGLEGRLWQLQTIIQKDGMQHSIAERDAIIAYFEDGTVGGQTACNSYGGPYTVEGQQLRITGPLAMTLQACPDVRGEQEALFIAGLEAANSYTINGDQLIITFPDGRLIFHAQADTSFDEDAVYAALLREWRGGSGQFVILNETRFNAPGKELDETLDAVQTQLKSLEDAGLPVLDATTMADFRKKNRSLHRLDAILDIPFPVVFISQEEVDALFAGGEKAGWQAFQARYPDTLGILSLSRVGFDETGDQALVYMGLQADDDTGGFYSLLTRHNSIWTATTSFRLWGPTNAERISIAEAERLVRTMFLEENPDMNPAVEFPLTELTPDEVWQRLNAQVFQVNDGIYQFYTYLIKREEVVPLGIGLGGAGLTSMGVTDLDRNGSPELVYTYSFGSGIHRSHVGMYSADLPEPHSMDAKTAYRDGDWIVEKRDDQTVLVKTAPDSQGEDTLYLGQVVFERQGDQVEFDIRLDANLPPAILERIWR